MSRWILLSYPALLSRIESHPIKAEPAGRKRARVHSRMGVYGAGAASMQACRERSRMTVLLSPELEAGNGAR